ncbi:MAG: OmpA family protein [Tannerella sp.]|uniref:OmpA family protein n=1 Tax=Tannerella sp. TaxID=2382127 RepID=UPI003FA2B51A
MEQEKTMKCIKCHKDASIQGGVKTPNGVVCKSCVKKSKMMRLLMATCVLLVMIVGAAIYYFQTEKNNAVGFEGVTNIQDSTNVIVEKPAEKFILETAVAKSNPVVAGQTIDNIESFKRVLAENLQNAEQSNTGSIIIPNISVLFDLSSDNITPDAKKLLLEYAKAYLQTNKQAVIFVEGYACNLGSKEINDLISKQRAESVKNTLVSCGISESNIEIRWYGKSKNVDFSYSNMKDYRRVIISIKS